MSRKLQIVETFRATTGARSPSWGRRTRSSSPPHSMQLLSTAMKTTTNSAPGSRPTSKMRSPRNAREASDPEWDYDDAVMKLVRDPSCGVGRVWRRQAEDDVLEAGVDCFGDGVAGSNSGWS